MEYTSKYLGMKIDGWEVISRNKVNGKYSIFTLQKKGCLFGFFKKTITVSDKTLRAIVRGEKTISGVIEGKEFCEKQFRKRAE